MGCVRVWSTAGTDHLHREVLSDGLCTCEMERSKGHCEFAERGPEYCLSWSAEQGNLGARQAITPPHPHTLTPHTSHPHTLTPTHHHLPFMMGLSTELRSWSGSCKNSSTLGNKYPMPVSLRKVCEWEYMLYVRVWGCEAVPRGRCRNQLSSVSLS